MQEAIVWLEDGGEVAVFCESVPWQAGEPDARMVHRRRRSFAVACGQAHLYVTAILVAVIKGNCRNLDEEMRCRIYERRPLVCRVYPAEISPFIQLNPAAKACPPEAWMTEQTFDLEMPAQAAQSRETDYDEAGRKGLLCSELGFQVTALALEGYVCYQPAPEVLLAGLRRAYGSTVSGGEAQGWQVYSSTPGTVSDLGARGLEVISAKGPGAAYSYFRA